MDIDPFTHVSLREHLEEILRLRFESIRGILDERERLTEIRFRNVDTNVNLALQAKRGAEGGGHWMIGVLISVVSLGIAAFALLRNKP